MTHITILQVHQDSYTIIHEYLLSLVCLETTCKCRVKYTPNIFCLSFSVVNLRKLKILSYETTRIRKKNFRIKKR
jgi:hypothetical protein